MVAPAVNVTVPDGANQIAPPVSAAETTVTEAPPIFEVDVAKTVFWFEGATLSKVILVFVTVVAALPAKSVPLNANV